MNGSPPSQRSCATCAWYDSLQSGRSHAPIEVVTHITLTNARAVVRTLYTHRRSHSDLMLLLHFALGSCTSVAYDARREQGRPPQAPSLTRPRQHSTTHDLCVVSITETVRIIETRSDYYD